MASNNELQTSRIIGGGPGSSIDNNFRDVEAAMRTIFGITADTDYSEAMQIITGPDATMTGALTLAADPEEDLEACTKQYVDNNAGTAASIRCSLILSDGQLIADGDDDPLEWATAHVEAGGECWDVGEPTRLIFPVWGHYFITGVIVGRGTAATPQFTVAMKANSVTWLYDHLGYGHNSSAGGVDASVPFAVMEILGENDYIEIFVAATGSQHGMAADCYLSMMKVGG
jgi:hypothetical protein